MNYERWPLGRLKTEAERWVAAVGGVMPITGEAAKELRDIVQRAYDLGASTARPEGGAREWLIWSNEHRAWWGPERCGYPLHDSQAGRYTLAEARDICRSRHWDDPDMPPETMIHEAEVAYVRLAMNLEPHMSYEVGQSYHVPCVKTKERLADGWLTTWRGEWIPVIGPMHRDGGVVNFPWLHWHVDLRFVSDFVLKLIIQQAHGSGSPFAIPLQKHPLTYSESHWRGAEKLTDTFIEGAVTMKRRKCRRVFPAYPAAQAKWLPRLCDEFKDVRMKGMVCPHRGIPLEGCPREGDVVTCPGHGLRWNVATGALEPQS